MTNSFGPATWLSGTCSACGEFKRVMRLQPSRLADQYPLICKCCYDRQANGLPIGPAERAAVSQLRTSSDQPPTRNAKSDDLDLALPVLPVINACANFGLDDRLRWPSASLASQNYGLAWFCQSCGIFQPAWHTAESFRLCVQCDLAAKANVAYQLRMSFRNK